MNHISLYEFHLTPPYGDCREGGNFHDGFLHTSSLQGSYCQFQVYVGLLGKLSRLRAIVGLPMPVLLITIVSVTPTGLLTYIRLKRRMFKPSLSRGQPQGMKKSNGKAQISHKCSEVSPTFLYLE